MKEILQPLINKFVPFAKKRMGFNKPPRIFLRDDPHNAQDPLGKTAYYDPQEMSVTLFTRGRHPKDIMRSLSHELVHHTQNCNGEFEQTKELGDGYAQNDEHLRNMERQAYEQGNMCFRDWEDSIKGTIYIQNMNVNILKEEKTNMSIKDWKNNELKTLLTERWGFSFNLLNESQEEVIEEGMCQTCNHNPCRCPMEEGEDKEELEEAASSSGRMATPDRAQNGDRREDDERKRPLEEGEEKEEQLEEESKKMVKCGDKGMVPDYACDGEGSDDLKKESLDEAKIRQLVRQLVQEAAKRGKK